MSEENLKEVNWERDAIEKIALAAIHEQKRTRFWSLVFKGLTFIYLFLILFYMLNWVGGSTTRSNADHTALIDIQGEIGAEQVNADSVISSLQEAYEHKHTKGIILRINSPGGSPVQAGIINDEITRQRKLHPKVPIYTVVEDICASGGYYIAVATDKIYVDKASIIGSIGVLMDGFGFTGAMEKFGVERRLMTAGENKAMLDPFSPLNAKHQVLVQSMLNEIHQQFISVVRQGRGNRLIETPETFSGLFWSGESGIKMGLADGLGSMDYVAREVIKEPNIVDFTSHEDFADRLAKKLGASMTQSLLKGVSLH
jgi:protease-4